MANGHPSLRASSVPGSPISFAPRPPFLPPRERQLEAHSLERFRRWLSTELRLPRHARVAATEWVSFDGREAPHVTLVTVTVGAHQLAFSLAKPLKAIERADLPSRLLQPWPEAARGARAY